MSTLVPARISTKFILLAVSLVLLTALALSILFVQRIRFESEATLISNGRDFARLLASNSEYAIYTEDTAVLRSLMNSLSGREEITYASIIGADGRTLIDRWFQETLLELPTLDPPSEQREQAGAPVDAPQFTSTTDGLRYQDLIASVLTPSIDADEDLLDSSLGTDELAEIGYVRLILNEKGIKRRTDELIWATVLLATVLSTLAIVVTIFLANRIAAPISVLVAATRRVAARQLDEDIRVNTTGELKELSDGFNYMLDGLRRYRSEREIQQEVLERKVAERTRSLEAAKTEAEAASHAKSEFLARMSHEIRTPMNGVLGMTELLLSSTKLDQQQRRYAETIYQSGDSLLAIINDILDVAKIESGKLELDIAPFDIRRTVEESLELLAEQAHSKGLELIWDIPPDMQTHVQGDAVRLRQILINLLGNAVKFTEHGEVILRVIKLEDVYDTAVFRFEVEDTGIGIRPENQQEIFESFSQEDGSVTRKFGGTGLGLSISKELVGLMNGEIRVNSTPGRGSTFWFTARLRKEADQSKHVEPDALGSMRILIVDDNSTNLEILSSQLENWGLEVVQASSGAEALERLCGPSSADGLFEMVVLDMHMPGMDGLAVAQAIRADPSVRDIPLVMLSSVSTSGSDSQQKKAMLDAWLTKPVRQSDLYDALARMGMSSRLRASADVNRIESEELKVPVTGAGARILLVEDNPVNLAVGLGMLAQLGFQTETANNGREALEMFRNQAFDLVVMDCQMPEMDGYEATGAIRDWEVAQNAAHTPIIALTANAVQGDREACLAAGMDDYLSKPLSLERLKQTLSEHLAQEPADGTDPEANAPDNAPAAARESTDGPLDASALETIRELQQPDGPNLLEQIVGLYLETSEELMQKLRAAVSEEDPKAVREAAHALKSSSANVGAKSLAELCKQLEAMGRQGNLSSASLLLDAFDAEYKDVVAALRKEVHDIAA